MRFMAIMFFLWSALVLAFIVTQIMMPMAAGTPLVPILRKKPREIEQELSDAKETATIRKKRGEIDSILAEDKKQPESKPTTKRK